MFTHHQLDPDVAAVSAVALDVLGPRWQRPLGRQVRVSGQYLQAVVRGRRPLSARVRRRLGLWAQAESAAQVADATRRAGALAGLADRLLRD